MKDNPVFGAFIGIAMTSLVSLSAAQQLLYRPNELTHKRYGPPSIHLSNPDDDNILRENGLESESA